MPAADETLLDPLPARYRAGGIALAEGWRIARLTPPSRLFCANGLRTGADGRIYVAQVSGSQISAIDVATGAIETVCPMGGPIIGPDDLAFDSAGNMYVTELTEGRVSMVAPNGIARVLHGEMPVANPVTVHKDRVFAGECRPGARIMELDRDGGVHRILLADVPMVNAFEVGPDGRLYFPVMGTNEIWRVDLAGGAPEVVVGGLAGPDAVKFDAAGCIVSTQVATGEVLRIDPRSGARTTVATIAPGIDNCTFVGERLFVSSISGQVTEVLPGGELRALVPDGLQFPLGLAVSAEGTLFVADGGFTYMIAPGGARQLAGTLFTPGFPGYARGVAADAAGAWIVTTANGDVARYDPGAGTSQVVASGYDQLYGVAERDGRIVFSDMAAGRLVAVEGGRTETLADGLDRPKGVAIGADGEVYVAESGGGRLLRVAGPRAETVADGLKRPEGVAVHDGRLYVTDADTKELIVLDPDGGRRRIVAAGLPIGAPPGVQPKPLHAFQPLCGALGPFAGVAAGGDGTVYVSGDAEGSVLALTPPKRPGQGL